MLIAQIQFAPWDKVYNFSLAGLTLAAGDYVVVKTELGLELGKVVNLKNLTEPSKQELKPVLRLAAYDDIAQIPDQAKKTEVLKFCEEMIQRHGLPMKLIDVHFSLEGNRFNFAFLAEGRVDFRDLVKDLVAHFNVNVRLTQIGTRDEARVTGDCGPCGRGLCCRTFINEFSSITSEMAEAQQVVHRGSERISGMCGRLMCCLSFEYEGYKKMAGELPPLGTKVNIAGTRGVVVGHHILKQTIDVRVAADKPDERDVTIEVDINKHKGKEK